MPSTKQTGSNSHVVGKRLLFRSRLAVLCDHSAATCAPFAATERFMKKTRHNERDGDDGENEEAVEIGEGGRLLVAQVREALQGHLFRGDRIAGLLEKTGLGLIEIRVHRRVERIEIFAEAQAVELLAAFVNGLGDRSADAAAFVAQQREQTDGGAAQLRRNVEKRGDVERREDHRQAAR